MMRLAVTLHSVRRSFFEVEGKLNLVEDTIVACNCRKQSVYS